MCWRYGERRPRNIFPDAVSRDRRDRRRRCGAGVNALPPNIHALNRRFEPGTLPSYAYLRVAGGRVSVRLKITPCARSFEL
jgi:hypothetical protein